MEKVKEKMNEWKIDIVQKPLTVTAQVCKAGDIEMAKNGKKFAANCNANDFDRNIQSEMYSQKDLGKWCIIHTRNTAKEAM